MECNHEMNKMAITGSHVALQGCRVSLAGRSATLSLPTDAAGPVTAEHYTTLTQDNRELSIIT